MVHAQLLGITGANHPELHWKEFQTPHFTLVYHQGLDSIVRTVAAPIAEEVYHVVTTNLQTPLSDKVRIYFSDNDEMRNAFTFGDEYIFVWMRGILDDNLFSLRSSGRSKWLRSVITHEFTHIVIAHATRTWEDFLLPAIDESVPRWFNEGMARYMEPDGWTNDLDIPLRMAAVSSQLDLGSNDDFLSGTLLYEGGQSLVRYIAAAYGDTALVKILKHRTGGLFPYNFDAAVQSATGHSLAEIYADWHKVLNVYYNTQYGQYEDIADLGRKIPTHLAIVEAARLAPDGRRIAVLGKVSFDAPTKLYLLANDTGAEPKLLNAAAGIETYLSWSPDGKYLLFSKIRFGRHADLVYDLYRCNSENGSMHRVSSNERLEYPDWSPDGNQIVAAQFFRSGSDLVLLDAGGSHLRKLTNFDDDEVQIYSPRWSPDGSHVAFSIFRKDGKRDIATVDVRSGAIQYLTDDSVNNRYPIWSPQGDSIVFLSFDNGLPNLYSIAAMEPDGHYGRQLTDVASNLLAWDIAKDSILVSSLTERNSVHLFWIAAHRSVSQRIPVQPVEKKYSAWRSIRWPLVTPPLDSTPAVTTIGPFAYNSFAHIRPLIFLPLVGTDIDPSGTTGLQLGAATFLADEMQKHLFEAFAWYGDESHTFSGGIQYENNQLLPTISIGAADMLEFRDILQNIAYYERTKSVNLGVNLALHTPNSLTNIQNIFIGAEWNDLNPWNSSQFSQVDSDLRPLAARMLDLNLVYNYFSSHFQFGATAMHADKSLASTLTWTRLRATLAKQLPLDESDETELALTLRAAADYGDELPQDFLGFYKYDAFEGGFNLASLHENDRLRGIRRYVYGNRLISGSLELRQKDGIFSSLVPILKNFDPQLVEFFDMGAAWYANTPLNNPNVTVTPLPKTAWLQSAGMELRSDLAFGAALEGGVGWELVRNPPPDWYLRITGIF